ncbi:helix-turn-helix domain-containing protein [Prauserella flavalba]|uniref:hypothetical protein n=1 Tax=Prauserella flavalba TaxID=1477506 RepID=UPI0036E6A8FA
MDFEALVVDAFAELGVEARPSGGASGPNIDLIVDPDGVASAIQLLHRALVTDDVAVRLLAEVVPSDAALFVVADRVTDTARRVLTSSRGGYFDLRGRLALRTAGMVIDAEVEPVKERAERTDALAGSAGLEVATALLLHPERAVKVRALARELGRSPSTVSEVLAALRRDGLIGTDSAVADTRLFWQVAARWSTPRTLLAALPVQGDVGLGTPLRLGLDDIDHESGWALTDSAAAVAYGAPLAFRSDHVLDFFVPDRSILRRATTLLGAAPSASQARATVRVAPVPAVVRNRVGAAGKGVDWPLAHPLFVALDLAQDAGRGREVLEMWTPDGRWTRVW